MPPEPNRISHTFYLLLTSLFTLTLISYTIPESIFELYSLKKTDFLEPVLALETQDTSLKIAPTDKIFAATKPKLQSKNVPVPCSKDIVCLEDYSGNKQHMAYFLEALYQRSQGKGNCRIAFYGDSFIEGDILTCDLRDTLQKVFGGKGIGFLPISSEVSMFRRSLPSESEGWKTYTAGKASPFQSGISGHVYQADQKGELALYPNKVLSSIRLLCRNTGEAVEVESIVNKKLVLKDTIPFNKELQAKKLVPFSDSIRQYKLSVAAHKGLEIYGLSLEEGNGLYLDNFSLRGNSGLGLSHIPTEQFQSFQKLMDYKLIILEFGLNVAAPKTKDFSIYEKNMTKMILNLKTQFPNTSFLLLSTSDRSSKQNGTYATMPSIPLLVEAQRRIAQQSGILFWNMYKAMGGENGMIAFVKHKPALANKDYTHLTFAGGKKIASSLAKSLFEEYAKFQNEKKEEYAQVAVK